MKHARHIFVVLCALVMALAIAAWWRSGGSIDYTFFTWSGGTLGAGSARGVLVLSHATRTAALTHALDGELGWSRLSLELDGGPNIDPVPPDMNLHAGFGYQHTLATDAAHAASWRFVAMPWWFVTSLPLAAIVAMTARFRRRIAVREENDPLPWHGQLARV